MNDATRNVLVQLADERRSLGEWKPQQAKRRDDVAEAMKQLAAAVRDWALLDDAVDQQISDQRNLVEWWGENVSVRHASGTEKNADRRSTLSVEAAQDISGIEQQKVSKWRKALNGDLREYRDLLRSPSWRKAMGLRVSDEKGASGTGENEWFTPTQYIEAARLVMRVIDLDPATSPKAQELIQATQFYTKTDNGLQHEWHGHVWLNPPYAQPLIAEFVSKLCEEWRAARVVEAILLTHNYTDTSWFHEIAANMSAICFTRGRVKFYEGGKTAAPTQGQAFSYFGTNAERFAEVFEPIGFVVVPR